MLCMKTCFIESSYIYKIIMNISQLGTIHICSLCVLAMLFVLPPGVLGGTNPLIKNVGQDVVFMWNRSRESIDEVRWGFEKNGMIKPQLIYINRFTNVPILSSDLDTPAASKYKGRVHYVGNLTAGRAWFKITNLTIGDADEYVVSILEGVIHTTYKMILVVAAIPTFHAKPPQTQSITEGQDLRIPCIAIGPPTPLITWIQKVPYVIKGTGTGSAILRISNIRRDQNGTYECQASNNPNENPVTAQTVVFIYYPPQSSVTPRSVSIKQGHVIVLSCTADGYPPPSISWAKADGFIKAGHTVSWGTLRIPDAIKTDAGKYICTAKNTYDSREHIDNATATVIVKYQASIIHDKLLNRTVNESDTLSIKCDANGNPPPTIKWKTPTGSVHTGNVYNIPTVSRSHAGAYTCTAGNGIGREAMVIIHVTVQYKPAIKTSASSLTSKTWNGNSIHLRCLTTGLPSPRISWYKPTNQQINTGVNIVPGGSEVTVMTTADQGDYGQYKCRATNILGSDEHVINVTQLFPPGPVTITIDNEEASSITVRWTRPADNGGSPVTGYLLEVSTKSPVITVNTHAVITRLKANTQYTVKVYSQNAVGYGVLAAKVVRTKKIGKPAVPELLAALLEATESKLSVVLRWEEPDDNGCNITRYTIYMKEVTRRAEWIKYYDLKHPNRLVYRITKNIAYGKTYMFMVTAWNKYGESVRDEGSAKTINTTADKAMATNAIKTSSEDESKASSIFLGVIIAFLVLSICFNVLQFLYLRRRIQLNSRNKNRCQKRKIASKKDTAGGSYENDFELEDKTTSVPNASPVQQPVQTGPEYETIQESNPKEACSSDETSYYQELNLLPNTSFKGTHGPVYEPLRTRSVDSCMQHDNDREQHPYEPLNIKDQNSLYQSLQTNSSESAIK